MIYEHVTKPVERLFRYSYERSFHPPLMYFSLRPVYLWIGYSEFGLRLFHVLIGILTGLLPLFSSVLNREKRVLFSCLLMASFGMIRWSGEVLGYSLTFFLSVLFLLSVLKLKQKNYGLRESLFLLFITIIISYFNYILFLLTLCFLIVHFILNIKNRSAAKAVGGVLLGTLCAYIPWIFKNHLFQRLFGGTFKHVFFYQPVFENKNQFLIELINFLRGEVLTIVWIGLFLFTAYRCRKDLFKMTLLLSLALFHLILVAISIRTHGVYLHKFLNISYPFMALIFIFFFEGTKRYVSLPILILIACVNLRYFAIDDMHVEKDNVRGAIEYIGRNQKSGIVLINDHNNAWYNFYTKELLTHLKLLPEEYDPHCLHWDKKELYLNRLRQGDTILLTSHSCLEDEILAYLNKNHIDYVLKHFQRNIKVLTLIEAKVFPQ